MTVWYPAAPMRRAWRVLRASVLAGIVATCVGMPFADAQVAASGTAHAAVVSTFRAVRVDPCRTDPAMTCDHNASGMDVPHLVLVPARPASPPQLAVFFPGTGGRPTDYAPVGEALARAGMYVIGLRYPTSIATENACTAASYRGDPACFQQFRSESVFGENVRDPDGHAYNYAGTHIERADSVMNRLLKLVVYLVAHPAVAGAGWGQFLAEKGGTCDSYNATYGACDLDWGRVALGGHSQGGGIALYIARFYSVARVAMLSGPEDAYLFPGHVTAAPWITQGHFATPAAHMYGFTSAGDPFYRRQTAAWAALGLPGAITRVTPDQPLGDSHRIVTSIPSACPQLPLADHLATSVVGCVDLPVYRAIWLAMFGATP